MATIYLSSTYEDLKDYRRAVFEALRKAGHQVIAMEEYIATDQRPVDKCLKDVGKADIYVGFFAFRYGYIPPVQHNNPNGLSITELEFQHAEQLGKPCLVFLADQKAGGFPVEFVDAFTGNGAHGQQVKRLRDYLGSEKTASFFSGAHHLASLVLAAVSKHFQEEKPSESAVSKEEVISPLVIWDIEKHGSPYPGLMHFTRQYVPVFFGRDAEIRDILDRLRLPEGRFLIISGASGTGKSSLVSAGVLPVVETAGITEGLTYLCIRMVPSQGQHPFDALMRSLHGYAEQAGMVAYTESERLLNQPSHLLKVIQVLLSKCFKNGELVLFLDQMEELFTVCDRSQAHDFLAALYQAVHGAPIRVIATIRSDFLHHCHEQADLLNILNGRGHIGLGPIDAGSIRDMICKPAVCAGLVISPQLARRFIREAGSEPGNLPLLAFALQQLFDKRNGKELTEAAYDGMGGLVGAVGTQADQVMQTLDEEVKAAFDRVFAELVHLERDQPPTRRRVPLAVFEHDVRATQLIRKLAGPDCRILVIGEQAQEPTVEVAHEKLFSAWPMLKDWINDSSNDLRLIDYEEEAAQRWYETGCHLEEVWRRERAIAVKQALKRFNKTPSHKLLTLLEPQLMLIERLDDASLPHEDRLLIGQKLCEFDDPRRGVGLGEDGLPDIVWIEIPGGQVRLENSAHVFTVHPFRMARYTVTNAQFQAFLDAPDGYRNKVWWRDIEESDPADQPRWSEANSPRETVSWFEAVAFCRWLSAKTMTSLRLPTEWEWQQAATGGDLTREYPWKGIWDDARCNNSESRLNRTMAVGMYPSGATQQGLMDMAGNVSEWCQNKFQNPERPEAVRIDNNNHRDNLRAFRGGSWLNIPDDLRAFPRFRNIAVNRGSSIGFRLAQDIP